MDIERLRRETAEDHQAVEGAVPLMGEGLGREDYVRCLLRVEGVVSGWEEWVAEVSPEWMQPMLKARRRTEMLQRDLSWFGVAERDGLRSAMPQAVDEASVLGSMYVMEGSTLGGQLIARHVERVLGLQPGRGDSYFRGHGDRTGTMWKEFCEVLKTKVPESESDAVIVGAKKMFQVFGTWMQGETR